MTTSDGVKRVQVEVWSDVACPWCWVGKRHLEEAIEAFGGEVEVTWRAFELDPQAPESPSEAVDYAGRIAAKYRCSREDAQAMIDRIVGVGAADGLDLRFDRIKPGNTFDAHRLLHLAGERGLQDALKEGLFRAYLHEGRPISDPAVLLDVAVRVGLEEEEARGVLESTAHAEEVRAEESEAHRLGVTGVPFFVIDRRYGVSGAQPAELLLRALAQSLEADGRESAAEACATDGCGTD